jgi:hypothetical protein
MPGEQPRVMPDAGVFAVADQLAVAGHDLAEALRNDQSSRELLDEAVGLVEAAAVRATL